jgi:hypothetical protein
MRSRHEPTQNAGRRPWRCPVALPKLASWCWNKPDEPKEAIEMITHPMSLSESEQYELRYQSLFIEGRAYSFPCDATGRVNMDALSDRARHNYFYVRTVVGREFATPAVRPHALQ